jgi:hypothetical protein
MDALNYRGDGFPFPEEGKDFSVLHSVQVGSGFKLVRYRKDKEAKISGLKTHQ